MPFYWHDSCFVINQDPNFRVRKGKEAVDRFKFSKKPTLVATEYVKIRNDLSLPTKAPPSIDSEKKKSPLIRRQRKPEIIEEKIKKNNSDPEASWIWMS